MELLARRHREDVAVVELYVVSKEEYYLFGTTHIDWFIEEASCHTRLFKDEWVTLELKEKNPLKQEIHSHLTPMRKALTEVQEEQKTETRFVRVDDCYRDQVTGLEWALDNLGPMCWEEAIKVHESLEHDWRLPTIEELVTLLDYGMFNPATCLPDIYPNHYWSGSPYAYSSDYAWYVHFHYGNVDYDSKTYHDYVRCVRDSKGRSKQTQ